MNKKILSIIGIIIFFIIFEIFSRLLNSIFLPYPSEIIYKFIEIILSGTMTEHIIVSMIRIIIGFSLAVVIAIPLGLLMGRYLLIERVISPVIEILRYISPIALLPAFILLLGIGLLSKIAIIFWVAWIPILLNTISGVKHTDYTLVKAAISMGAGERKIFKSVFIPASMPYIITGLRIGIGSSFLALLAAEMIGSSSGIGFFILNSAHTFKIPEMYAGILAISIIGFLLNAVFLIAERKISRYRYSPEN